MNIKQFAVQHKLKPIPSADDDTEIIPGRIGHSHIFVYDEEQLGVAIIPETGSSNHWTAARKAFGKAGMTITQNGDEEGVAVFDPENVEQVKLALRYAGVGKKKRVSPEQRAALAKARAVATRNRASKNSVRRAHFESKNDDRAPGGTLGHSDKSDTKNSEKLGCTVGEDLVHSLEADRPTDSPDA